MNKVTSLSKRAGDFKGKVLYRRRLAGPPSPFFLFNFESFSHIRPSPTCWRSWNYVLSASSHISIDVRALSTTQGADGVGCLGTNSQMEETSNSSSNNNNLCARNRVRGGWTCGKDGRPWSVATAVDINIIILHLVVTVHKMKITYPSDLP